ncbi:uncharacterized protein LOC110854245 [Folsomia candida]|uniref:uncharacterized protein LOC110854245 n=1 Tax=Folsomia candida TaxID=158441 RepID=UPI000B8F9FAC|nr:uncharacterized protein LOC110854245 [Folsomia candida]
MAQLRRTRKISLQNDYAYCIISPVSPSVVPIQGSKTTNRYSSLSNDQPQIRTDSYQDSPLHPHHLYNNEIEEAEEAYLSLETNTETRGFRRWSFCNFQTSGIPVSPAVSEATALEFGGNNYDGYGFKLMGDGNLNKGNQRSSGSLNSSSSSSTSLSIISGMISNIPDRIRKISSGNKLDVVSLQRDEDARDQLRKLVVY